MMGRSTPDLQRLVGDILREEPAVVVAYLFGSRASGKSRRDSDLDVAVIFAPGLPPDHRFGLRCRLSGRLGAACGVESADVIDLAEAPPLLAHRILRAGHLLFSRDEGRRVRVAARQVMRYIDTRPMRRALDDATFRRLGDGSFGRIA